MEGSAQGLGYMCVAFIFFVIGLFFTITGIQLIVQMKEKTEGKSTTCSHVLGILLIVLGITLALGVASQF